MNKIFILLFSALIALSCGNQKTNTMDDPLSKKVDQFAPFKLSSELNGLSENQKQMLPLLFQAADIMDELFWLQAYGNKEQLLNSLSTESEKQFALINYGPWERLNDNAPFIESYGEKPEGANFYPHDMTREEFEAFEDESKTSLYTIIQRNEDGNLVSTPYHVVYADQVKKASDLLLEASKLAEDEGFKKYLELRAEALLNDDYFESDMAWMDMKNNKIDFVVGPIENYEDQLYGYKTAYEAYILIKDTEWSDRLAKYAALLPELQKNLPVEDKYKQEEPGANSDLGAYEVLYYAGDCNSGSKTIAINLPNDPNVQLAKGSRRLQLKNAMQAKFDKILLPISDLLIDESQQQHVSFDAFFGNVMFHEVAHGLGIKNTITTGEPVRESLKDAASSIEEGKADILGLFLVTQLVEMNEMETDLMDNYVTFMAGLFRSIRFGASSAHGVANLVRFNYFQEKGAFTRSPEGIYTVNYEKMQEAMDSLSEEILVIQGDGNYQGALDMIEAYGEIPAYLEADLARINSNDIPVDIVFDQGLENLPL